MNQVCVHRRFGVAALLRDAGQMLDPIGEDDVAHGAVLVLGDRDAFSSDPVGQGGAGGVGGQRFDVAGAVHDTEEVYQSNFMVLKLDFGTNIGKIKSERFSI